MTSNELKALVKEYFNLVDAEVATEEVVTEEFSAETEEVIEETVEEVVEEFGEISDINKAFVVKFPGDKLEVGDDVTIVTTEGQEMPAPDGTHELADGTKIVTMDSKVTEIMDTEEVEAAEEEEKEEEMMEEVTVEVEPESTIEEVVAEIAEAVKAQMATMEEKVAVLEEKVAMMEEAPAVEPTVTSTGKEVKFSKFDSSKAANSSDMDMMLRMIKNKK